MYWMASPQAEKGRRGLTEAAQPVLKHQALVGQEALTECHDQNSAWGYEYVRGLVAGRHSPQAYCWVAQQLQLRALAAKTARPNSGSSSMYHDGDTESNPAATSNRQVANVASSTCYLGDTSIVPGSAGGRVPAKAVGCCMRVHDIGFLAAGAWTAHRAARGKPPAGRFPS
ncbi:uncharacterized protein TRIVIDRAFT_69508 [Trichoderma virens Gv29-8]|uniref:Uncharacterized protein n=1 Tax=Hypocrea virens (strain Gv29-8 / FGSC 10586) TaxID=413071 RepID=G9MGE2_HYPVG|nr:uncharacterized protein TRIVIDRAFT_69508 [Trichoderma virens Gv29-8]EHK26590.1 hypothetical protein TRIVIDRAFT_69508 [Trichoderma virens Gv29-8]